MDKVFGDPELMAFMRNWLIRPSLVRTHTYEPTGTSASDTRAGE